MGYVLRWKSLMSACRMPARAVLLYTTVTIFGTTFFFFLHHLGNQIPYDLAQQRFADEFAANLPDGDIRYFSSARPLFDREFCEIAMMVLAGAERATEDPALMDAVLLENFEVAMGLLSSPCVEVEAASGGAELPKTLSKARYWWGSKALFAIALQYLSVFEIHWLIRLSIFGAYLLLAATLLLLGCRPLLAVAPLIVFNVFFSRIGYFADIANGIPHLWAVLAAALLALLLGWRASTRTAPLFCFITGMVSSYLWLFDGHNFLAMALIGSITWFGYERLNVRERTRRSVEYIALYIAGFAVCLALGQATKAVVYELGSPHVNAYPTGVIGSLLFSAANHLDRITEETLAGPATQEQIARGTTLLVSACPGCGALGWQKLPIIRDIRGFWMMVPIGMPAGKVLSVFSGLALLSAAFFASLQAWRGRPGLAYDLVWIAGLMLLVCFQFILPDDFAFRTARFVALLLALCWSCFILALMQMSYLRALVLTGGFLLSSLLLWLYLADQTNHPVIKLIETTHPAIRSDFDVYHDRDRLIYVRDQCSPIDTAHLFFLHIVPVDKVDLSEQSQLWKRTFDNLDFHFNTHQVWLPTGCAAIVDLPDYDIASIRTGQFIFGQRRLWSGEISIALASADADAFRSAYQSIVDGEPVISSTFDIYLNQNSLTYVKNPCNDTDTQELFFLHLIPTDRKDLPSIRKRYGFDNRDFEFFTNGMRFEEKCMATVGLPDYDIASINTGQFVPGRGKVWEGEFHFRELSRLRKNQKLVP